ncbi:MAG: RnfH family protein [Gammaproteobacteria bacterium]|nr:MAG: RnfH family protein [Gammaproteobacteria bacterium]
MDSEQNIRVTVVYALSDHQELIMVKLPENSTVEQAINESGILQKYSEIDIVKNAVGIYGKVVQNTQILHDQDRVEIYRQLTIDPMHARRRRAELQN